MKRSRRTYPTVEQVSDLLIGEGFIPEPFRRGAMKKNWKGFKCREIVGPACAETYGRRTFVYVDVLDRLKAIKELKYNDFPVTTDYGKDTNRIEVRVKTFKANNWWE